MSERYNEWLEFDPSLLDQRCGVCKNHTILILHWSYPLFFIHTRVGFQYPPVTVSDRNYIHVWEKGQFAPPCISSYRSVKKEKI